MLLVTKNIIILIHCPSPEVGAAVSVLLGFAPPSTLSTASSSKLNGVLMPNPFDRPVLFSCFKLQELLLVVDSDNSIFTSAQTAKVMGSEHRVNVQRSDEDEDEVSVVSLSDLLYAELSDKERSDFNADKEFIRSLVSLIHNIRRAIDMHQGLSESLHSPAELIAGRFDGIKIEFDASGGENGTDGIYTFPIFWENFCCLFLPQWCCKNNGAEGIAKNGLELFLTSVSKTFDSLQAAYKGQIVGFIIYGETITPESENMINVVVTSRPSPRLLEETKVLFNLTTIAGVILVRRTLAWITGIILLIATFLGVGFLLTYSLHRPLCFN
ncbi:unnamed protein product [Fraxinus pennsylvanica]|uniref:DUF7794 domain-containing protein n=1 Tax=Fraxinus pennsylvanica TaxID=56036 RepID=A0AAD2EA82_9LAMI|nr:unnamed protein product [Fraxinus pennsylvanica]